LFFSDKQVASNYPLKVKCLTLKMDHNRLYFEQNQELLYADGA
jgi:hypothetical protein